MARPSLFTPSLVGHYCVLIAIALVIWFTAAMPVLSTFGPESANLFAGILGPLLALLAAIAKDSRDNAYAPKLVTQLQLAFLHLVWLSALLAFNERLVGSCSPGAGALPFLVFLVPPVLLNIAIGTGISCLKLATSRKFLVFLLFYAAAIGLLVLTWWQEPNFRLFSHLTLIFTADLLNGITLTAAIAAFRLATLLWALIIAIVFIKLFPTRRIRTANSRARWQYVGVALLMLSAGFLQMAAKKLAGKNYDDLRKDYSLAVAHNGIVVRANPHVVSKEVAQGILDDALFWQWKIGELLPKVSHQEITIWLHKTHDDRYTYTGAKNVHFALPRRRELHISGTDTPHMVLGHELAHIYLGEETTQWTGLPGSWGLIPNLALSEGMAMYLTEPLNLDEGLSTMEQAAALWQSQVRVDFDKLFSTNPLAFASLGSEVAYIYSSAFLEFHLKNQAERKEKLRALVQTGTLSVLFNADQQKEAIVDFQKFLNQPMPKWAINWAKNRFQASSILTKNCRPQFAKAHQAFEHFANLEDAQNALLAIARLSPADKSGLIYTKAVELIAQKRLPYAISTLSSLQNEKSLGHEKNAAIVMLARAHMLVGEFDQARAVLQNVQEIELEPSERRQVVAFKLFLESNDQLSQITLSMMADIWSPNSLGWFAYNLGLLGTDLKKPSTVLSRYIFARLEKVLDKNEEALSIFESIANQIHMLPEMFVTQAHLTMAKIYLALKKYPEALSIIEHMMTQDNTLGHNIELNFLKERATFFAAQAK